MSTTAISRGFDQAGLDREYSPSSRVESLDPYLTEWARRSAEARARLDVMRDLRYAPGDGRLIDFFPAREASAPLLVFVHGGYWCELTKDESSFLAPAFVRTGAAFATLDYPLAPAASLPEIVAACEQGLAWLVERAGELGFDRRRVVLCGLSAGAHLSTMLATSEHTAKPAAVVAISGIYDLEPIRLSYVNEPLGLDPPSAVRCSPIHRVRPGLPPLIVAHGDNETDEFKRQSAEMAVAWRAPDNSCRSIEVAATNHFNVIDDCCDPTTDLGCLVFELMDLAP